MPSTFRRAAMCALGAVLALGALAPPVLAKPRPAAAHGDLLKLRANANQSSNWFGYNQGALEQNGKLFNSISGDWTVPTATQHTAGQAENSSDWIGIGGGGGDARGAARGRTPHPTGPPSRP